MLINLAPLQASRGLPLGAKGRLCSAIVHSVMLYGSDTLLVNKEGLIRQEQNYARTVRGMSNVRTKLNLKSMRECLKDRKLQWSGHLKRKEESACSSKCRTFKVSSSFPRR